MPTMCNFPPSQGPVMLNIWEAMAAVRMGLRAASYRHSLGVPLADTACILAWTNGEISDISVPTPLVCKVARTVNGPEGTVHRATGLVAEPVGRPGNNFRAIAEVVRGMHGRRLTYQMIKTDNGLPSLAG